MRILALLLFATTLPAQTVAIVNGKPVTEADLEAFKTGQPPEMQGIIGRQDTLLRYYGFVSRMAELAEKAGLADRSPYKEQLALARKQILAEAMRTETGHDTAITPAEEQKYYDQHREQFFKASIQAIYVPVQGTAELVDAKAKGDDLAKKAATGFAALAKQFPLPATSPDWPGAAASIRRCDTDVPSAVRDAIFAVKPGELTVPVVLPHGIYIFRVESVTPLPLSEVRGFVSKAILDDRYQSWMNSVEKSVTVEKPAPAK